MKPEPATVTVKIEPDLDAVGEALRACAEAMNAMADGLRVAAARAELLVANLRATDQPKED